MSYNGVKGTYCPCGRRWYVCPDCSPSTAIAHKNRIFNNTLIKKPLEINDYRIIKKAFYSVLEKYELIRLRKRRLNMEQWNTIEPELFKLLRLRLPGYNELHTSDHTAIGCDKRFFIFNIQRQLKRGMELGVYRKGIWDIDHIRACDKFDLTHSKYRSICFNYKNFQPMWTIKNQQKGAT
jgi:hypothetical protein